MSLDEAIRHCLEVAERCATTDGDLKCESEHRQLAEWLKDYKRLLAVEEGIDIRCGNCKHDGTGDGECEKCYMYKRWELEDAD